ncbi:arsenate reductase (glutaredoxin) [Ornithobacterium rhinotracheale]|uniref:arsenate reductase (glutaredoxin) n=1 Tax=Ornithobacterium rhinotracheale TaxID=28251 RepID=UPI00129C1CCD|nr:arsenate reductase (glutaredoxin) [Ornithobacterium rhinotracheale]MRJ07974.1 arsenate reductase (glutaredoxin) [Ornithobacterium rhinotracheale]MRJ10397.1 arsenate reductase (glutaredoxin) [Ornithobacterium rhinotracheale]UOH78516.1 arsenate reductase (glutaredoxin) [Ornithobacterium rhinotracheale]
MIEVYHNPRCSKSRAALQYLEDKKQKFEIYKYLDEKLSKNQIQTILDKTGLKPIDLVRTNEAIWKENYKGKDLTDEQIISAIVENPKLLERPIVINGDKAVVARPTEKIDEILG